MNNPSLPAVSHELVTDATRLQTLCAAWQQMDAIALDTEFVRTNTYYAMLGLVQIYDGEQARLLDPLQPDLQAPLATILGNAKLVKVLHSCSEDIQILQSYCGVEIVNVFDTQIAAAMSGFGFSLSYQKLVESICGVQLPKDATRSDWLQRPLADAQLDYAALDVIYLLDVYTRLRSQLERDQRLSWLQEDCEELLTQVQTAVEQDELYLRVKVAWQLNPKELHILRALCSWREEQAVQRDKPRNWIVSDRAFVALAKRQPTALQELNPIDDLSSHAIKRYGKTLLDLIVRCTADEASMYPPSLPKPLGRGQNALLKKLKALVRDKAEQLKVAPEVVVRKKDYEQLLRNAESGELAANSLPGWRHAIIGTELIDQIRQAYD
ncbi:MAG: ribonuclease D [Pseudomonadales bacterium]